MWFIIDYWGAVEFLPVKFLDSWNDIPEFLESVVVLYSVDDRLHHGPHQVQLSRARRHPLLVTDLLNPSWTRASFRVFLTLRK